MKALGPDMNAIPVLAGSPLLKNLSIAILMLSESGQLTYLHDKWWASSCVATDRAQASKSLQPHGLLGPFLFLGVGLGMGLLLALMELLSRARDQTRDGKVRMRAGGVVCFCSHATKRTSLSVTLSSARTTKIVPPI